MSVNPPELAPGVATALVRVVTNGASAPRLVASSGSIKDLRPDGPDAFVADYFPANPDEPKVAIIAAGLGRDACGFAAVRVAGRAETRAAGPVALLLNPTTAAADREVDVTVYVFALDESGRPWAGSAPALAVSNGTISPPRLAGSGVWRTRWHATPQEGRAASVAASLAEGNTFTASLDRPAGPVASLRIEFDRPSAAPGDPRPVMVTIQERDAAGNPSDAELSVESDLGGLGDAVRIEQGLYRAPLQVYAALRDEHAITVEARSGSISEQAVLPLGAGPAHGVLILAPQSVPSDGQAIRQISVSVQDAFGNPVEQEKIEAQSKYGDLGVPSRVAPGRWIFSYKPHWSQQDSEDVITVRAGSASATRSVALVAPTPLFSFAPKVGGVLSGGSLAFTISADIAFWMRLASEQVGLSLDATWWEASSSGTTSISGTSFNYTNTRNYVPVVLYLAWRRAVATSSIVVARLGGGAAWIESTSTLSGQPSVSQSTWAPTVSASVAYGMRFWNGYPFVELRVGWVGNPSLANLSGSVVPVSLLLGYRFDAG